MSSNSSLFLCLLLWFTFGCVFIPPQDKLVTSTGDDSLTRNNGSCSTLHFSHDRDTAPGTLPGLSSDSISMLSWNIYKGQRPDWADVLSQLCTNKNIIFLQEASLNIELRQILHQKNLYWSLNSAFKFKTADTGVLVASTTQPLESCGLYRREPIIGIPKTTLISRYRIADSPQQLMVANIHAVNISFGTGAYQDQLDSLQNILKQHKGPLILAGDFNTWSKSRTDIMMKLTKELSLLALTFKDDERTTFFGDPVDHIFYRGLKPVSYNVHRVLSSDHNPISATFRLDKTQEKTKQLPDIKP